MRAKVLFTCNSYDCEEKGKVRDLSDSPYGGYGPICRKCLHDGRLEITAGEHHFRSGDAYVEFLKASAKELKLLRRLVSSGAAEQEDQQRVEALTDVLEDAVCPCCHHPIAVD